MTGTTSMGGSGDIAIVIQIADGMRRRMIQDVHLIVLHIGVGPDHLLRGRGLRADIAARRIAMTGIGKMIEIMNEPVERIGIVEATRGELAVMTGTETAIKAAVSTEREGIHTPAVAATGMTDGIVIVSRTLTTTVPGLHDALLADAALHHARLKTAMAAPMTKTAAGTTLDATTTSTIGGRTLADSLALHSQILIPKHWKRSVPAS